jgi:hypothetical protein
MITNNLLKLFNKLFNKANFSLSFFDFTKQLIAIFSIALVVFGLFVGLGNNSVNVHAQTLPQYPTGCKNQNDLAVNADKISINIVSLYNINNFLPLVPEGCAYTKDGNKVQINALGVDFLADLIIRLIGFIFALGFYLVPFFIIVLGFFTIFVSYLEQFNIVNFKTFSSSTGGQQPIERAVVDKVLQLVAGIVLLHVAYALVFTILGVVGLGDFASKTDISKFLTIPEKQTAPPLKP